MTQEFGRRDFLKIAGVTSLAGAGAFAASSTLPKQAKAEYMQPASWGVNMSVKYLDTPSYNLPPFADADKLEPYNMGRQAFVNPKVQGKYFEGKNPLVYGVGVKIKKNKQGEAGFSQRDIAFSEAAGQSWNMVPEFGDWGTNDNSPYAKALGKWQDTPENNTRTIKKVANFFGAGVVGVAELNRKWVYTNFNFADIERPDKSTRTLPNSIKWVIPVAIPCDGNLYKFQPTMAGYAPFGMANSTLNEVLNKLCKFIRHLGYNAIPSIGDIGLNVPMAIEAGLGELSRLGLLITPEFGPNIKLGKVLTDLPLAADKPIIFGAAEFCKTCKKCAEMCPAKAISFDEEPSYNVQCPSNNPGMKKWYVNTWECINYGTHAGSCAICQYTCTYSKPQTWVHDTVKVIASKTSLFNSVFTKMDSAFGYGGTFANNDYTQEDIDAWWNNPDTRMYHWHLE